MEKYFSVQRLESGVWREFRRFQTMKPAHDAVIFYSRIYDRVRLIQKNKFEPHHESAATRALKRSLNRLDIANRIKW